MQIKGKQVRLGIKAAATTIVHREEIYQRIQEENRQASQTGDRLQLDQASQILGKPPETERPPERTPLRRHVRPPKPKDDN